MTYSLFASGLVRWLRNALLLLSLVWLVQPVHAGSEQSVPLAISQPLKVSFTEFRPYGYTDIDGVPKGTIVEIARELLDTRQFSYTLGSKPTARIYHQLKVGELDLYLGPQGVPTLQGHVWEVQLPEQYSVTLYLWRKAGTPETVELEDLRGQSLAVINGFTYRGLINKIEAPEFQVNIHKTSSHENAFKMLVSGRVDYLLDYGIPIEALLPMHPEITLHRHLIQERRVALIISRKSPQGEALFSAINQAVIERFPAVVP
ncbi:substrate-binding periplasmic protein [Candidatus Pelagadaptatus aseana]|uniref:substrate-binding periplasmic protein n=1 Tax=Candidatus Pelagadaptatus aseana TaxID=3120508 RepID=UPI003C6F4A13